jgi:hypothetical protein
MARTYKDIRRFRQMWRKEFGEKISEDEARYHIRRQDTLYLMLSRRPPKTDWKS